MHDALPLAGAGVAGFVLGGLFYGGLWWTVRRSMASQRPALWVLGSLLLRTSMALAGFYFAGDGQWQRLVACLLGFVMARAVAVWRLPPPVQEAGHAP